MKVMVLGGRGFVGRRVVKQLQGRGDVEVVVASRSAGADGIAVDSRDEADMTRALQGVNVVVNCVTGDGQVISEGARALVNAALKSGRPRIVHLSTMSVYGSQEGVITEDAPLVDDLGWYGHAKIEAEGHMQRYASQGGEVVILRPGVIIGPDSDPWVRRFVRWLQAGRLGDLGPLGDGPANLVDVEDVAQAVVKAIRLELPVQTAAVFNLVAPDSPRWNDYFRDLSLRTANRPLERWGHRRLKAEVLFLGVPLKVMERVAAKLGRRNRAWPEGIPPSLTALWGRHVQLSSKAASQQLSVDWTPYIDSLTRVTQGATETIDAHGVPA